MKRSALPLVSASLVAISTATLGALAFGCGPSGLERAGAIASLCFGAFAGWVCLRSTGAREQCPPPPVTGWQTLFLAVFALAALRSFVWLAYESGDHLMVGSRFNLGDIALHLNLIHNLSSGVRFWPENTIFADGLLRYPAGMDLFNATLSSAGFPVLRGLIWTGLVGSALAAFALRRWGGALALAALLFNGGLAGFAALSSGEPGELLHGVEWKNLFLAVFVTQRSFLWALPAGLLLLCAWRDRLDGKEPDLPHWAEILLYATMPLFHLHTFLFLSLVLAAAFLLAPGTPARRAFLGTGAAAFLPASLLAGLSTGWFAITGTAAFAPGWMQGDGGLEFWWMNFGVSLPLLAVLGGVVVWKGSRAERAIVGAALLTWAACALFRFAPWPWDNVKLMLWAWLACMPFLWERLLLPLGLASRTVVLLLLFFSGALALIDGLLPRERHALVARDELATVAGLVGNLPASSRFAAAPEHSHPLLILGKRLAMGYPGHLWSHGYDYSGTEAALEQLYRATPDSPVPAWLEMKLTHVFVGPRERMRFGQGIWQSPPGGWREISKRGEMAVYEKVSSPSPP